MKLDDARNLWRQAALDGSIQFFDTLYDPIKSYIHRRTLDNPKPVVLSDGQKMTCDEFGNYQHQYYLNSNTHKKAHCAITLLSSNSSKLDYDEYVNHMRTLMHWTCPECHVEAITQCRDWMIHVNNMHQWDWLQLANKFPDLEDCQPEWVKQ